MYLLMNVLIDECTYLTMNTNDTGCVTYGFVTYMHMYRHCDQLCAARLLSAMTRPLQL